MHRKCRECRNSAWEKSAYSFVWFYVIVPSETYTQDKSLRKHVLLKCTVLVLQNIYTQAKRTQLMKDVSVEWLEEIQLVKKTKFSKKYSYACDNQTWGKERNEIHHMSCFIICQVPILTNFSACSQGARFVAYKTTFRKLVNRTEIVPQRKKDIPLFVIFNIGKKSPDSHEPFKELEYHLFIYVLMARYNHFSTRQNIT